MVKMERLNSNVGSAKSTLQQRPEIIHSLSVNLSTNVLTRMVDNFMDELNFASAES